MQLCACAANPVVEVDGELLQGDRDRGEIAVFRGVPFAEPPVGDLRWQRPQPLQTKSAVRDATKFRAACMQSMRILNWYRDLAETFGASRNVFDDLAISEDCLYLNVWTPDFRPAARLPVMVFIHGGSNNSGWAYEPNYHGNALAGRGVVVVSIAYRLGVFGFFSHPETSDANFGLWDQLAALEWVQRHIATFGGDPARVTVFGESAGAQDVLALMASPRASGLFHRAILQSTAGFGIGPKSQPTLDEEQRRGVLTADLFGFVGAESLEQLRQVPAARLLRVYEDNFAEHYHTPAIDNSLLSEPVWHSINAGRIAAIPIIIGTNADEWYESAPADADSDDVIDRVSASRYLNAPSVVEAVLAETDPREALDRIDSAEFMLCPSQRLAAMQTARYGNAWVYYFSRVRDGAAGSSVRAYHGAELPYVFGSHDPWLPTTDVDWLLTRQIMGYWTSFAGNGDPNATGSPPWATFSDPAGPVMTFANEVRQGAAQEPVLCAVFRQAMERAGEN